MTFAPTDEALAAQARAGSAGAFAAIVARHQGAVRGFLRRACGNWADADDLAQETFVAAWTHMRMFEGRSSLRSWLCGIAYKKCLGNARARGRAMVRDATFLETNASGETIAPDELMDLAKAMKDLSIDQRAAVALCLAQGFSHGEAADALGLPLGTIKSHVQRGRQKLLEALGDE
jgi:RNA polymerase sigma factor (sigma-70 family)